MCQVGAEGDKPGLPLVLADDEVPPREIDIAHAQAQCLAEAQARTSAQTVTPSR